MKRKPIALFLCAALLIAALPLGISAMGGSSSAGEAPGLDLPSLAEVYRDYFLIGGCFGADKLSGGREQLFFHHYNAMTAENAMKPIELYNRDRELDFRAIDAMLEAVSGYGNALHGHTLVWHEQSPAWLNRNGDGSPVTRAVAERNMAGHISGVAGHFAGKVYSWDVINEALHWGGSGLNPCDWRGSLRKNEWYRAFDNGGPGENGYDYIDFAFRQARAADPGAILYYNDFGLDNARKAQTVAAMVREINGAWLAQGNTRLLIEGIGMQGHYDISTRAKDVEKSIRLFAELGVKVSISELDVDAEPGKPGELLKQAAVYAELFRVFKAHGGVIERVSFWGLDDGTSWLNLPQFGGPGIDPLLFDAALNAKPAYYAAADPEGFLETHRRFGYDIFFGSNARAWMDAGLYHPNGYLRWGYTLLYWLLWPGARAAYWVKDIF